MSTPTLTVLQPTGVPFPSTSPFAKPLGGRNFSIDRANPLRVGGLTGGAGAGKAMFNQLVVSLSAGVEQSALLTALASGQRFVVRLDQPLTATAANGQAMPYVEYTLNPA